MSAWKFGVIAGMAAASITAPALAGEETQAQKVRDPNEMVCEKSAVLGSRVATKKVCMTRAQWAELRLQERQEIDKVQTARGQKGQ